ncbi:phage protein [Desulfovibrio falkowii]|uniref:phage protein n=1 Tax=Desulfovibrio sp. WGS1351 TaxID=3366814 RepID=UPI00372D1968
MSRQRIGAKDFDITIGDLSLTVSQATLGITDNIEVAKDKGVPNGWVAGDVGAEGDMDLDALGVSILSEAAASAGSWRELPEFDMLFFAKAASGEEMKVEAFGCKLKVESLLTINSNEGASKHTTKVKFLVTSPDFVHINGVPYLGASETEGIVTPS